ncbi:MAG: oligosaccharide flippase family protein, partial [bacterium]
DKKKSAFVSGGTDEEKVTRFVAGGVVSIIGFAVGGLFGGALWMIAMTQMLGPQDFGILGPIFQGFFASAALVSLGIPQAITTYVSHHYEFQFEESKKFIIDGNRLLIIIAVLFFVVLTAVTGALFLSQKVNFFFFALLTTVAFGLLTTVVFWSLNGILNGFQRLDYVAIGNIVAPVAMFITSMITVVVIQQISGKETKWDIWGGALGLGAGGFFGAVCAALLVRKTSLVGLKDLFSLAHSYGLYRKIITFGGVTTVALVGYMVFGGIVCPLVGFIAVRFGWFAGTYSENLTQSGYFSAAFSYAMVPMLVMGIVIALIPAISEAEGQGKKDLMQKYFALAVKYSLGIMFALFAAYAAVGGPLVELLSGGSFPARVLGPITTLLCFGFCFNGLYYLLMNLFIGLKRPIVPATAVFFVLTLEVSAIIFFSYFFRNILHASLGMVIALIFGAVYLLIYTTKVAGLRFYLWIIIIPTAALIPSWLTGYFLLPKDGLWAVGNFVITVLIFTLFYAFFGGYDTEDFKMFRETMLSMNQRHAVNFLSGAEKFLRKTPFFEWYNK